MVDAEPPTPPKSYGSSAVALVVDAVIPPKSYGSASVVLAPPKSYGSSSGSAVTGAFFAGSELVLSFSRQREPAALGVRALLCRG